jgi:hypothetical protein
LTTPNTALIAPAICGETLKRPGSLHFHLDFQVEPARQSEPNLPAV